ncbi:MAG: alpha/beta fold hydrolase, partial [Flavobacteriales bacterium]
LLALCTYTGFVSCISFGTKRYDLYRYAEEQIPDKDHYSFRDISIKIPAHAANYTRYKHAKKDVISGTLIMPKGPFDKVVVIVPGSGYDKRNSHFLLAEAFLRAGIAVFRFDDRGFQVTELRDLRSDLFAFVSRLRNTPELKGKKLGLLGHSLGGLATIDVYQKRKPDVDFLVQWATPIEKYGAFFIYQLVQDYYDQALTAEKIKTTIDLWESICSIVAKNSDKSQIELYKILHKELKKKGYKRREFGWSIAYPNNIDILKTNYESVYRHIGIPMLYIIGSNDRHVDPKRSTEILKKFHNDHIQTVVMKGLNHSLNDMAPLKLSDIYRIDQKARDTIINFVRSVD